ncbi:YEATS domain-containing protein 2 [Chelonus insularis]|uniref:YEATS domain-containing protein 2 n=1 Tax=Chelonus insularis TaxID=460826 RepID=UPI00158C7A7B|nr:YEATS domain-containing protein 2 [Chelonus insularis]XP_034950044.1 YEATS domain-containing protein 2 [Chelonus insularis]
MNTSKDSTEEQDPEYITTEPTENIQQQLYEEIARKNASEKIKEIIDKEFSREIDEKEEELLLIQDRLHSALKTLHLLRYVIVTDYYNRKQCIAEQTDELKQTRIHPAIKELLGKAPRKDENYIFDPSKPSTSKESFCFDETFLENDLDAKNVSDNKHFIIKNNVKKEKNVYCKREVNKNEELEENYENKHQRECLRNKDSKNYNSESGENFRKKTLNEYESDEGPPRKVPRYIPPKSKLPESPAPSRGVHHKVRKRIVVGNISKWIPPEWREDAASHKWTMYVRGSKEEEYEISEFVSKVRFFLHPSYRPNDVVEVTSAPFYLSRRGWGEFPLRVQLHFKNPLNKPMNIIHHLKLDRTYTGLQTLGSETVVDIWIKNSEFIESKIENCDDNDILKNKKSNNEIEYDNKLWKEHLHENYHHVFMEHDYTKNNNFYFECTDVDNNVTIAHSPEKREEKWKKVNYTNCSLVSNISRNDESVEESEHCEKYITNNSNNSNKSVTDELIESKVKNGFSDYFKMDKDSKCILKSMQNNLETLKPLKIEIPSPLELLKNSRESNKCLSKKIVLVNDNRTISTNAQSSNKNIRPVKSVSLLKNSINSANNNVKKNNFINIQINPAKSVMLDTNSYTPALQIAHPLHVDVNNTEKMNNRKQKIVIGKDKLKIWSRKEEFEKIIKEIINVRIKETEPLMRFILRRIPIITENASDAEYREMHPYVHKNEKEFLDFHPAKQRALEWFRAKKVQSYLLEKNISEDKIWTIKEIIWWCRLHGYTPIQNSIVNINTKYSKSYKKLDNFDFFNTCTESSLLRNWIEDFRDSKKIFTCLDNEIIDVESIGDDNKINVTENDNKTLIMDEESNLEVIQMPKTMIPMYSYICGTARKIGITIGPEEIVPGVSDCTSGRIIIKVVECLMQDLLRLSLAKAWERNDGNYPDVIVITDVRKAILSREEFDIFTNAGLGSSTIQ